MKHEAQKNDVANPLATSLNGPVYRRATNVGRGRFHPLSEPQLQEVSQC